MKKLILILSLVCGTVAIGQTNYNFAVGLRAGETSGLTIKKSIGNGAAIEGIFGAWRYGLSATALFEKYVPVGSVSNLNWYYGAGGHVAVQNNRYYRYYYYDRNRDVYYSDYYYNGGIGLGLDGILGMEYKIPNAPIALSLDIKPFFEVNTHGGAWVSLDPGLGIKVAL